MYRAPLKDLLFVLNDVVDAPALGQLPRFAEFSADLAESVLAEAGRFAAEVLDPLNRTGDVEGARWTPEGVRTAKGFADAYRQYASGGWTQLGVATEVGGQGMPLALGTAVEEIGCGANTAFMLCPLLARGAIEAIALAGSPQLRECYLPKLVSGEWTGTMNLTEPQAGSDLAAIRTRAEPRGDHHRIFGQKIFITYGDHDMAENIVHLVLARIDGAPAGVKGISLFVVPKRLPRADGSPGEANDLRCAVDRAQARHPRQPDLRDGLWRQGRRRRLPRRRAESRPRIHVHHDECGAPGRSVCRASVSASAHSRQPRSGRARACRAGSPAWRMRRRCRSSSIRTCGACCSA